MTAPSARVWRHKKSGHVVIEFARGELIVARTEAPIVDMDEVTIYVVTGGTMRARRRSICHPAVFRTLIADATMQTTHPLFGEIVEVVMYYHGGKLWVRPTAEFEDGRFEPVGLMPDAAAAWDVA